MTFDSAGKVLAVRSVVDYIASNVSRLHLRLFEEVSDTERERAFDHPAAQTLLNPNERTTPHAFIYRLVTDYLIWDNAYFIKFRSGSNRRLTLMRFHELITPTAKVLP